MMQKQQEAPLACLVQAGLTVGGKGRHQMRLASLTLSPSAGPRSAERIEVILEVSGHLLNFTLFPVQPKGSTYRFVDCSLSSWAH